jgi:general stress protein YciG
MTVKALKGFAAMAPEVRRAIQSKGGRAPRPNRGFASDPEWAAICGAKGGRNGWEKRRAVQLELLLEAPSYDSGASLLGEKIPE